MKRLIRAREQYALLAPWRTAAEGEASGTPAPAAPAAPAAPDAPEPMKTPAMPPTGGLSSAIAMAQGANNTPYDYGHYGENGRGYDCSGYMSGIYNSLTGKNEHFATNDDFGKFGFVPGYNPDASFNIGVNPNPGEAGHMAGSLGGTFVESNGPKGTQYGGAAVGPQASQFSKQYHLPNSLIVGNTP